MSEEQEKVAGQLITEAAEVVRAAKEAKETYSVLIKTFAVAIFIAVSSVSVLVWRSIHAEKDIDYIRNSAVNKEAFLNLMETYKANSESLTKLINNEEVKAVVSDFNRKTDAIVSRIMASQTEIVPRGAIISQNKKMSK